MADFDYNFKQTEDAIDEIMADERCLEEFKEEMFHNKTQFIARLEEAMDPDASPERLREIESNIEEYFEHYSIIEDSLEAEAEAMVTERYRLTEELEEAREKYQREQNEEKEEEW